MTPEEILDDEVVVVMEVPPISETFGVIVSKVI